MASKSKHRRFFRSEDQERRIDPKPEELGKIEVKKLQNYLHDTYGIDLEYLESLSYLKRGKDVWITNKATKSMVGIGKNLNINSLGLRALRNAFEVPKITTNFAILLDNKITKNYHNMTKEDLDKFSRGNEISIPAKNDYKNYLILKYNNEVYGVGLINNGIVKSQVPKGRLLRNNLEKEIDLEED
jgi:NOL1/NOP2/fmu family ribosome biogenesis protein